MRKIWDDREGEVKGDLEGGVTHLAGRVFYDHGLGKSCPQLFCSSGQSSDVLSAEWNIIYYLIKVLTKVNIICLPGDTPFGAIWRVAYDSKRVPSDYVSEEALSQQLMSLDGIQRN